MARRRELWIGWWKLSEFEQREITKATLASLPPREKARLEARARKLGGQIKGNFGIISYLELIMNLYLHPVVGEYIEDPLDKRGRVV